MDYKKKIIEYRKRIRDKETLKFVDFLELLIEWVNLLSDERRLKIEGEKGIIKHFPNKIFFELDKIDGKISLDKHDKLKRILLKETSDFLIEITKSGDVRMVDFDSIQFNLYGIFGKEEIASMVEHVRIRLEEIIQKRKKAILKEKEKKISENKAWLKKVNEMPENELIKLITKSLFKFTPSSRTNEERLQSIRNNQETILSQKKKFHNFEQKIIEATEEAKAEAETSVNRQVGKVRRRVMDVSKDFAEKAKEFVSEEGPKKMINKARKMIVKGKEDLTEKLKDKGKSWENKFKKDTEKAQSMINNRKLELFKSEEKKRDLIKNVGYSKLKKAEVMLIKQTGKFEKDVNIAKNKFSGKAEAVLERGQSELDKARKMIFKEKSEFVEDVVKAKKIFDEKGELINTTKFDFSDKSEKAAKMFIQRGSEIEDEMFETIFEGRKLFEENRFKAQKSFEEKAVEIKEKASKHISEKKELFSKGRDLARKRFLEKSGGENNESYTNSIGYIGKSRLLTGAGDTKGKIKKANTVMIERAKSNKKKMEMEMQKKRDLFMYDVRFAQEAIKKHAKQFSDKILEKKEIFEIAQEKIVARHKAKQKAHLIQNLLRTIRSMH